MNMKHMISSKESIKGKSKGKIKSVGFWLRSQLQRLHIIYKISRSELLRFESGTHHYTFDACKDNSFFLAEQYLNIGKCLYPHF